MNRWSKQGVPGRVFTRLQEKGLVRINLEIAGPNGTIVPVNSDGTGAEKTDRRPSALPQRPGRPASSGDRG